MKMVLKNFKPLPLLKFWILKVLILFAVYKTYKYIKWHRKNKKIMKLAKDTIDKRNAKKHSFDVNSKINVNFILSLSAV